MTEHDSARISPTAHYTGYVWCCHGLAPSAWATRLGRAMFYGTRAPLRLLARSNGGLTLEQMLLQRHRLIDHLLERAIEAGTVGQVVEVAAGQSARGLRFTRRFLELIYIEADLPQMVARKRGMLAQVGGGGARQRLVVVDALHDSGPRSLAEAVAPLLDEGKGVAILTEGLMSYFGATDAHGIWRRFGALIDAFPSGQYLSDIHLDDAVHSSIGLRIFRAALGRIARGSVHMHGTSEADLAAQLARCGLPGAQLHTPRDYAAALSLPDVGDTTVRVLEVLRPPSG